MVEYIDSLYRYAMVLTGNHLEAGELVQRTCIYGKRYKKNLLDVKDAKVLLLTILRNIWTNSLRRHPAKSRIAEISADERPMNASLNTLKSFAVIHESTQDQVRIAIQQLPIDYREVILLRIYEEMSYQEIATFTGCSVNMVLSRIVNARHKLRTLLSASSELFISREVSPKFNFK
jgi:RNA polymerase sigma-70 factor, ECF subfamily